MDDAYFLKKWKSQQSSPLPSVWVRVKPIFLSPPYVTSSTAQLSAIVFDASRMPKAFCNRDIEGFFIVALRAFLQVGLAHDAPEDLAVKGIEAGDNLHSGCGFMFLRRDLFRHIFLHIRIHVRRGDTVAKQGFIECDAGEDRLGQRFHLACRLVFCVCNQRAEHFVLRAEQSVPRSFPNASTRNDRICFCCLVFIVNPPPIVRGDRTTCPKVIFRVTRRPRT